MFLTLAPDSVSISHVFLIIVIVCVCGCEGGIYVSVGLYYGHMPDVFLSVN